MTGIEIFERDIQRDFSGSEDDEYGQTLMTIFSHIDDAIFPLLETAEKENKKLVIKSFDSKETILSDQILLSDIILQ